MKLAIQAEDRKKHKDFAYEFEIADYTLIAVAALVAGASITKTVFKYRAKTKEEKNKWPYRIFK